MSPYYGPAESSDDIFLERTFLAGDTINGIGYGIQLMLYGSCAVFLWKQRQTRGKQSMFLLVYISSQLIASTIFLSVQSRGVQDLYVDNRNYPGGPWQYFLATQNLPINVMFYAMLFVLTFLTDLLVLWRCWVIWTAAGRGIAYLVVSLPALMLLASFVMGTLWTLQSSQPGLSLFSKLPMAYGTSYYIISLSVNIILTVLITVRLLMYRRQILENLPPDHAKHYFSLMTIIIESAALYSVFAVIFIITYAVNNPMCQIFLGTASSAQQIAGYLIIHRLASGHAWNNTTVSTLPTLQFFNPSSNEESCIKSTYEVKNTDSTPVTDSKSSRHSSLTESPVQEYSTTFR